MKSCWNSSSHKQLTSKSNLASSKLERLRLQELCVSWTTVMSTSDQRDVLNAITPGLQKVSANKSREPVASSDNKKIYKPRVCRVFSSLLFNSHSFFWYAHTRELKPAKCLIHDSNITVKKLMKGTFVCMGQVKCKLCDKPKCVQTG